MAQPHHKGKASKKAFEILYYVKNLPFDRITRHCPLSPAFRKQGSDYRFSHGRESAGSLGFERQQIPTVQGEMGRLGYHSTRQNGLELRPRLEPPHA